MAKLGQHFLVNSEVADRIAAAARVRPGESAVEIGPGEGVLTRRLLACGARVTAVELDARLFAGLQERFKGEPGLRLLNADFLKLDLRELPSPCVFVANLPYAVAAAMLQRLLARTGWSRAVLMFQKEVAERLLAAPGSRKYGLLTVSAAMRARVEKICEAPRRFFRPPPRVDSTVVRLHPRAEPLLPPGLSEERYMAVVRAAFAHRRKTAANSLAIALGVSKDRAEEALESAGLEPGCRAEEISPEEFAALCLEVIPKPLSGCEIADCVQPSRGAKSEHTDEGMGAMSNEGVGRKPRLQPEGRFRDDL